MKLHLESTRASAFRKILTAFLAVQTIALNFSPAWAAPANTKEIPVPPGGIYGEGLTPDGNGGLTITKVNTTLDWDSFNIGSEAWVLFKDAAGDVTINKIGGAQSEIFGKLDANGIIYLLNKSGVLFGDGARVNVGGLVASTFMEVNDVEGQLVFQGDPGTGDITVEGGATINAGAFAYLVGQNVNLAGAVNAGDVIVAAFGNQKDEDYKDDGGKIWLKLSGNTNSASGDITLTTNFTIGVSVVTNLDTLEVTNTSPESITLFAVQKISQADGIWQAGAPVSLTAGSGDITLANENEFAGTVSASAANGALTLTSKNAIELGNVTAANLTVASKEGDSHGNGIGQAEGTAVVVTGMATLTTVNGAVILTNAMNDFGTVSVEALPHSLVQLTDKNSIELGKVDAAALTVTATDGSISQVAETAVNVKYGTELQASGAITLANTGNDFGWESGAVTAKAGGDVTLTDKNAIELGTVRATELTVTALDGNITQGDNTVVTATGATTLTATLGNIVLTNAANDFGGVVTATATNGNVSLTDANDLTLGALTAGGAITAKAATNVTLTGSVEATQVSITSRHGDIVGEETASITSRGAEFYAWGQGSNNIVLPSMTLGDDGLMVELDADAGSITQVGAIKVNSTNGGTHVWGAGFGDGLASSVILTNAANEFGSYIDAIGSSVDVKSASDLNVGRAMATEGGLNLETAGKLVVLTNAANNVDGYNVNLKSGEGQDIELQAWVFARSNLTMTAGGSIVEGSYAYVSVTGETTLTAEEDITMESPQNEFGTVVTATAGGNVTLTDEDDITLGDVTAGGDLAVTAGVGYFATSGNISQSGSSTAVTVTGTTDLKTEAGHIILSNTGNDFDGKVTVTAQSTNSGVIALRDANDLTLGDVNAHAYEARFIAATNMTLTGNMDVYQANIYAANGDIVGEETASITAGLGTEIWAYGSNANIVLPKMTLGTSAEDGGLFVGSVADSGSITQSGAIKVHGTNSMVYVDGSGPDGRSSINLTNPENEFEGGVEFTGSSVDVKSASDLNVRGADATGDLTLDSAGKLVLAEDEYSLPVQGANVTLKSGEGKDIEVQDNVTATDNLVMTAGGSITQSMNSVISASNTATLTARDTITLVGSMNVGSNLTMTAAEIDQGIRPIVVGGNTALTATNGSISMISLNTNDFQGTVTATAVNGNIDLDDRDDFTLGQLTASDGYVRVDARRHMTVDGEVTAGQSVLLLASSNMTVNAAVKSSGIGEADGGTMVSAGGYLVTSADATIEAADFVFLEGDTYVELAAPVTAGTDVDIWANARDGEGTLTTLEAATITAQNGHVIMTNSANVVLGGDVRAEIPDENPREGAGQMVIAATNGYLTVQDTAEVYAGDTATFTATGGDLTLGGPVAAGHDVNATTDQNFENTAEIAALDGDVIIDAGQAVTISEAVTATNGKIDITAGNGATVAARMEASRAEDAPEESPAGLVIVMATGGDVKVTTAGSIDAATDAELAANDGSVEIEGNGNVTAANDVRAAASEAFTVASGATVTAQGGDAMVGAGSIDIAGTLQAEAQNVGAGATNGNLNVTGQVLAGASIEMGAAVDATISGIVEGVEMVGVDALGKATVKDGGKVSSTGADGIAAVVGDEAEVEHGGTVIAVAGQAGVAAVNGTATIAGTVTAATNAVVQATGGKAIITSDGTVVATADGGIAGVESTDNAAEIYGTVQALGADGAAGVTGASATVAYGATVTAAQGTAGVAATDGVAIIDGTVSGRDAKVISENGTATISSTGLLEGSQDAVLKGKGDVKVESSGLVQAGRNAAVVSEEGDVLAEAGSTVTAGNDLVMLAEAGMLTLGDGAVVTATEDMVLKANGDVDLTTADVHGYNVGIESTTGDIADTKATLVADHTMVLVAGDDVTLLGGPQAENLGIQSKGDITFEDLKVKKFAATSTDGNVTVKMVRDTELAQLKVDGSDVTGKVTADRADEEDATITVSGVTGGGRGSLNGIQAYKGDVTIENPDHAVTGTQIVASRGTVDVKAATLGLDSTQSGGRTVINAGEVTRGSYTAGGNLDLTISGNLTAGSLAGANVNLLGVGGNLTAGSVTAGSAVDGTVNGSANVQTLSAGGPVELEIGSAATFGDARSGGDFTITTGGELMADNLNVGGNLDANVGGGATLTKASISGDEKLKVSGTLSFDTMSTHGAQIEAGSIHMGKLTAGNATIQSHGTITDNSSLVNVSTLTMTAGGDIGSAGNPINTEVGSRIDRISGRNIYLVEQSSGHNIVLGVIDASGHLSLSAPRIGLPDGIYGFMNGNGDDVNIRAGAGLEMNLGGRFGTADNPMRADVNGEWTILNGELQGTPMSYIYVVMANSDYTDTPVYTGTVAIPGLVIVNGRPILGHPDLLRKIYSALAFSVDTPELKSKQGIFGSPLFLHSDLGLFNGGEETGVDYWDLIQNDLLEPNNGKNAAVYGPRRWGLDDSLWDSERMSRSRLYLLEFDPLPAAKEKPATKATVKPAEAKDEAAKAAPAKAEAKPAAAKAAAKPAAKVAPSKGAGEKAK